jgi:hypothetical protein
VDRASALVGQPAAQLSRVERLRDVELVDERRAVPT